MRKRLKQVLVGSIAVLLLLLLVIFLLSRKEAPERITYGISFNAPYVAELGLDHNEVFDAFLDDLGVRHLRLAAHWTRIEPRRDTYQFDWLDYEMNRAEEVGAEVILSVGRRLPRWPECHVPRWAEDLLWEEQKVELREYITDVVTRYKDSSAISYWQVENEPYLEVFARDHCGKLDEDFLKEEIALVRSLDLEHPVLVTDSGNLGTWIGAYQRGDVFGTSVYVYFWNPELGQFKTILPPWYYRVKENMARLLLGEKETILVELSAEPWLLEPVVDVPVGVQYTRMDLGKFNEIIAYAKETRYQKQFLWGGEWWYWLKEKGNPVMWERGRELFNEQ